MAIKEYQELQRAATHTGLWAAMSSEARTIWQIPWVRSCTGLAAQPWTAIAALATYRADMRAMFGA